MKKKVRRPEKTSDVAPVKGEVVEEVPVYNDVHQVSSAPPNSEVVIAKPMGGEKTGPELELVRINDIVSGVTEIESREQYIRFGELLAKADDAKKDRHDYFEGLRKKTYDAYKDALKMQQQACFPFETLIGLIKNRRNKFYIKLEQERISKENKDRKIQDNTDRIAKEEFDKKFNDLKKKEGAEKSNSKKTEIREQKTQLIEERMESQVAAVIPVVENQLASSSDGFTKTVDFNVIIKDPYEFVKFVAKKKIPITCIKILLPDVKKWVKAADIDLSEFPCILKDIKVSERRKRS